jgi:hypothetical protein
MQAAAVPFRLLKCDHRNATATLSDNTPTNADALLQALAKLFYCGIEERLMDIAALPCAYHYTPPWCMVLYWVLYWVL